MPVQWFDKFDAEAIKEAILKHLRANPKDVLEYCKEYGKTDIKKYYGYEIISFYRVNPENGKVSKVVNINNKDYFKPIE
jgi:hypothetical protein